MLTKIRYLFIKVCVLMLSRLREILTGKDLHFGNSIVLHDHFEGCIEIANPEGSNFHPKGRSPEG